MQQNKRLYAHFGIRRSILRSMDTRIASGFLSLDNPPPPMTDPNRKCPDLDTFSPEIADACRDWDQNGFVHLKGFFPPDSIDHVNRSVAEAVNDGRIHYNYTGRKIFNAHRILAAVDEVVHHRTLIALLEALMGYKAIHFQTINFTRGSEQQPHSDAIHMTTIPYGGLVGVWVALEDLTLENGPLTYFPGSHKWPYITNEDYGNSSNFLFLDGRANAKYEAFVQKEIAARNALPVTLQAGAGDVFIWHANLVHGGAGILDPTSTRKSMVSHYFAEGHLCFHEISERPALL